MPSAVLLVRHHQYRDRGALMQERLQFAIDPIPKAGICKLAYAHTSASTGIVNAQ